MISPAVSTFLVDSVLLGAVSSEPIGSEAFTVSRPTPITQRAVGVLARPEFEGVAPERVRVRMSELLDAFKACLANDLIWIEDFSEDEVEISRDLQEVLEAFAEIRRQDVGEN